MEMRDRPNTNIIIMSLNVFVTGFVGTFQTHTNTLLAIKGTPLQSR